jgi:hypothetical protein
MLKITACMACCLVVGVLALNSARATVLLVPFPYLHIQDAIDAAVPGDTVSVWGPEGMEPPYTYYENPNYLGKGLLVVNRSFLAGQTGCDSSWDHVVIDGSTQYAGVVTIIGAAECAVLHGFTVTGGNSLYGGGVYVSLCDSAILSRNRIVLNTATRDGGGVYCDLAEDDYLRVCDNLVEGNSAQRGGGVCVYVLWPPDSVKFVGNTVSNNTADGEGGGVFLASPYNFPIVDAEVAANTVTWNVLTSADGLGAGIYVRSWTCHARRNVVTDNSPDGLYDNGFNSGPMNLGTQDAPGFNVLARNGQRDLTVGLNGPPYLLHASGNYWGTIDTRTILTRVSVPPVFDFDPVAASGKWFDVDMNSTCETGVIVTGDVTILPDCALDIRPGKTVEFLLNPDFAALGADPDLCDLLVGGPLGWNASLTALGNPEQPIVFMPRPYLEPEVPGDWYGITVNSGCLAHLDHCEVRFGWAGVTAREDADLSILNSRIHGNLFCGVLTNSSAPVAIRWSDISDNGVYGISCTNVRQNTVIEGDTLFRNGVYGIAWNTHNSTVDLCEVVANRVDGGPSAGTASLVGLDFRNVSGSLIVDRNHVAGYVQAGICLEDVTENTWLMHDTVVNITCDGIRCNGQAYPRIRPHNMIDTCKAGVFAAEGALPFLGSVDQPGSNSILLNNDYYVYNQNAQPVMAQFNWWGAAPPTLAKFIGPVDYYPWLPGPPPPGQQSGGASAVSFKTELLQPTPNPTKGATTIRYQVGRPGITCVTVTDATGQCVRRLMKGVLQPGDYSLTWDRRDDHGGRVSDGVYFVRLETPAGQEIRKVILTR